MSSPSTGSLATTAAMRLGDNRGTQIARAKSGNPDVAARELRDYVDQNRTALDQFSDPFTQLVDALMSEGVEREAATTKAWEMVVAEVCRRR